MNEKDVQEAIEDLTKNIIDKKNEAFVECLLKIFRDKILEIRETTLNSTTFDGRPVINMSYGIAFLGQEKIIELEHKVAKQSEKIEELENIIGNMGQDLSYAVQGNNS